MLSKWHLINDSLCRIANIYVYSGNIELQTNTGGHLPKHFKSLLFCCLFYYPHLYLSLFRLCTCSTVKPLQQNHSLKGWSRRNILKNAVRMFPNDFLQLVSGFDSKISILLVMVWDRIFKIDQFLFVC